MCCSTKRSRWSRTPISSNCFARSLFTLAMCNLSFNARSSSLPSQMRRFSVSSR
eukprot:CAMPEP_0170411360 /NCGR_PEP_ID=MMETSP0117_2-20130122/30384_1 /TAXON_ID=400756 /ORGANISM="Durinskia baltica, Strain CSIRO CS-38" /LENGTH=53 /DNA_ID=CAMNT_0010668959 /DNA_START=31 /DNA_END=188 /DNA_ORIENTATION=-